MRTRRTLCLALAAIIAFIAFPAEAATNAHRHIIRHQVHRTHGHRTVHKH